VCIGIIKNNSLVGGRARAETRTPATERITVYCTRRLSVLTTGPLEQVKFKVTGKKYVVKVVNVTTSEGCPV